jgi:hypothetical protein
MPHGTFSGGRGLPLIRAGRAEDRVRALVQVGQVGWRRISQVLVLVEQVGQGWRERRRPCGLVVGRQVGAGGGQPGVGAAEAWVAGPAPGRRWWCRSARRRVETREDRVR